MAEESKNEYAAQLQRFNRDQAHFYFSQMPQIFDKLQDMDERRVTRLGAGFGLLSEAELQVVPIIGKCLEGMKVAAESVDAKNVGAQHEPRGDEVWAKGGWLLKMCLKLAAGCHSLSLPKGLTGPHRITQVRVCPPR